MPKWAPLEICSVMVLVISENQHVPLYFFRELSMYHHPQVEDIEFHLRKVSVLIRHHTRELLSQYNLTLPQYYALLHLRNKKLTMGELCGELYLASSTVTDLVDRMEKMDYVQRVRDEEDRRVIRLQILAGGESIIQKVMEDRMVFLSKKLNQLDPVKVTVLLEALTDLHALMESE